jgi:SAM-dependent methyltransferase
MGHSDRERRRLALQAAILNPLTEDFLHRAGLSPGMRVLDLGCGVGEVALIAARLVGPAGHVTAIDMDSAALDIARARAAEAGLTQLSFEHQAIAEHQTQAPYDAVIGRLILIHTPDPLPVLRQCLAHVRVNGTIAFQEYDLSRHYPVVPPKPLYGSITQLFNDLFNRVACADIGMRLFEMFHQAGLTSVDSRAEFLINGGAECPFYEWVAETTRSLLPKFEATGLATARDLDVDTLAARLSEEAARLGGYVTSPVLVGTFGRRP